MPPGWKSEDHICTKACSRGLSQAVSGRPRYFLSSSRLANPPDAACLAHRCRRGQDGSLAQDDAPHTRRRWGRPSRSPPGRTSENRLPRPRIQDHVPRSQTRDHRCSCPIARNPAKSWRNTGEDIEPWPPCKAAPLMLKMSELGRGQDQRRSISAHPVGKPNTICSRAETDALVHGSGLG